MAIQDLAHPERKLWRWVVIDDVDTFPQISQQALRRPMETHSHITRFLFVGSSTEDLIPALRSRCIHVTLEPIDPYVYRNQFLELLEMPQQEKYTEEVWNWMAEQGMKWHMMEEVHQRGLDAVITDAIAEAMNGVDYLYVSVDIDSLDPAYAPGTGTPEPGGLSSVEMLRAIRRLAMETPLVAFDVMEVAPVYDHADATVNMAHRLIFETLAGLAWKKKNSSR
jgi:hypothetical protein